MRFTCPTCNQIVQVADEAVGQVVACPTCRQRLKVPGTPAPPKPAPIDKTVLGQAEPEAPYVTSAPRPPAPAPIPEPPAPRRRDRDDREWDERDERDRPRPRRDRYDDYDYGRRKDEPSTGMAITSLVLGIVGVVFSWCVIIGPICAILGIIFGSIHMSHKQEAGKGMAIGGLATGGAGLLFFLIFLIVAISSNNSLMWRF